MGGRVASLEKLIQRLQRRPPEASFDDVRRLLEHFGRIQSPHHGKGTSHVSFKKAGEQFMITVPAVDGRTVKRPYIEDILEMLGIKED